MRSCSAGCAGCSRWGSGAVEPLRERRVGCYRIASILVHRIDAYECNHEPSAEQGFFSPGVTRGRV